MTPINPVPASDQPAQLIHGPQTNISGGVHTGGGLFNSGTLHQYNFPAAGTPARDPVPLAVALARLAELPTDQMPPVAALPAGSWLPWPVNPYFVGRHPELLALARALKGGHTAGIVPGHTVAATGLGGIGKTQLAAAFAHHYGPYFLGGVYWLSFADPAAIASEVAQCAAWMSDLPPGVTHLPLPDQIQIVRRAWHEPLPRLLIFDNCEDPALLAAWRPTHGGCHIIVTSRRARWSGSQGVTAIPLDTLPAPKASPSCANLPPPNSPLATTTLPPPGRGLGRGLGWLGRGYPRRHRRRTGRSPPRPAHGRQLPGPHRLRPHPRRLPGRPASPRPARPSLVDQRRLLAHWPRPACRPHLRPQLQPTPRW
ncbi:MAG: ATP-binding protein [Caldilineaceae bacterium]